MIEPAPKHVARHTHMLHVALQLHRRPNEKACLLLITYSNNYNVGIPN